MNDLNDAWLKLPQSENRALVPVGARGAQAPLLRRYWRVAVRWKWVIAGIVAACLVAGLVVTMLTTPRYTATATLEIARQQDKILKVDDVTPETQAMDQEFYQTQYSLLSSRTLAESVVRDLRLAGNDAFFDMFDVDPEKQGMFVGQSLTPRQRQERRVREATRVLLEAASIQPTRGSSLVAVAVTTPDPALSTKIANAWTRNFIQFNLQRRYEATAYARKFLEGRLDQTRARLENSERSLVGYAANQRLINIPSNSSSDPDQPRVERPLVADELVALNRALQDAVADRIRAESRSNGGAASTEALGNDAISTLRAKRAEVAADYARLLAQVSPQYPTAVALGSQLKQLDQSIAREESRIATNLSSSFTEAQARETALRARVDALKSGLIDQQRRSIQYNIFQREADTNRQLYDALLQRYKEIGVAGGVGTNNIAVVDPAQVPEKPSSPKLALNLILALLAGVALGAIAAAVLEQVDEAVKEPGEVSEVTGLPLLGSVPAVEAGDPLALLADRRSSTSEAYLSVQTSLRFATDHGVPRTLAVTSTRPGEGKSTSAFAIARSLQRTGSRVVLVDADMRSPSVHQFTGVANARGVSNFLSGADDLDAMLTADADAGVAILTAGPNPPNAAELLTSPRMRRLLDELASRYDHVVLDCPPVLGLADAPLIGSAVEGMVYVVEAHGVRSSVIRAAIGRLQAANANLVGIVLTKFEAKRAGYGYGYDYGYGYGENGARGAA